MQSEKQPEAVTPKLNTNLKCLTSTPTTRNSILNDRGIDGNLRNLESRTL